MTTLKHQIEMEVLFLSVLAAFVSLFFVARANNLLPKPDFILTMPAALNSEPTVVPIEKIIIASQNSPDGTKKVIMKTIKNKDNTQTYTFSVSDGSGMQEQILFSKTLDMERRMEVPFNTWSPDNKYFFIQESSREGIDVKVFMSDGTHLDVTDLFRQKITTNIFKEATGWASESLIIINTITPDGTKGPSYWFEVPSKAVIQLATEF